MAGSVRLFLLLQSKGHYFRRRVKTPVLLRCVLGGMHPKLLGTTRYFRVGEKRREEPQPPRGAKKRREEPPTPKGARKRKDNEKIKR